MPLPLNPPGAPAALGAGGAGGISVSAVGLGVEDVLNVDPATIALEGSGVGLDIGVAEPLEAEGLYEKGGEVGNSVVEVPEGTEDVTEPGDVTEPDDIIEPDDIAEPDDKFEPEVMAEPEDVAEIEDATATEVVVVAGALEVEPEESVGREVDKVWLTLVLVVAVCVRMADGVRPGINMEERTGRSIV